MTMAFHKMAGMQDAQQSAMYPGAFGDPAKDCKCCCTSNTRARWALDEDELQTMKDRAKYFELDKTKEFDDFKKKYLKTEKSIENSRKSSTIDSGAKGVLTSKNDLQFKKRKAHVKKKNSLIIRWRFVLS